MRAVPLTEVGRRNGHSEEKLKGGEDSEEMVRGFVFVTRLFKDQKNHPIVASY